MAKKTNPKAYRTGIFVLSGLVIALGVLIWLGISNWFERTNKYATYFDVSVQGLNVDSPVKFRGVDIGTVASINLAPDNVLVEVVMSLNHQFEVADSMRAKVGFAGITGLKYIEIDYVIPELRKKHPKLNFTPELPVIPSYPGGFQQIEQALTDLYDKIIAIDTESISASTLRFLDTSTRTMARVDSFLAAAELVELGRRMNRTVQRVDSVVQLLDVSAYDRSLKTTLSRVDSGATAFNEMFTELNRQAHELRINSKLDSLASETEVLINRASSAVARSQYASMQTINNLNATMLELQHVIQSMNSLMRSLDEYPSRVINTAPPEKE